MGQGHQDLCQSPRCIASQLLSHGGLQRGPCCPQSLSDGFTMPGRQAGRPGALPRSTEAGRGRRAWPGPLLVSLGPAHTAGPSLAAQPSPSTHRHTSAHTDTHTQACAHTCTRMHTHADTRARPSSTGEGSPGQNHVPLGVGAQNHTMCPRSPVTRGFTPPGRGGLCPHCCTEAWPSPKPS